MLQLTVSYDNSTKNLKTIDVFTPDDNFISDFPDLWVIYIHGGAWRDPEHDSKDGHALIHFLCNQSYIQNKIAYASVNYRLSPDVMHPEHLKDVESAIMFLKKTYKLKRCILVGHSAGATLAIQYFMLDCEAQSSIQAVICVEGIYDLVDLVNEYPSYENFVELAFGSNQQSWVAASPSYLISKYTGSSICEIILIQSEEDELLSMQQTKIMMKAISDIKNGNIKLDLKKIEGKHFETIKNEDFFLIVKETIEKYL
ncbi:hypothetical protein PCANB_002072 [Pneumocystis canis]|nr:hypothetical protein PCK1_001797 [Pneumocystis canis]KAG5439498.1 hypothetical protein PCANB_002072 [Pneumocystis canis]